MSSNNAPPDSGSDGAGAATQSGERLKLRSGLSELNFLHGWIDHLSTQHVISENVLFGLNLCLEETVSNIITHGYRGDPDRSITISFHMPNARQIALTVEDQAPPFNPLDAPARPVPASLQELSVGGQGIRLFREFADAVEYERLPGGNRLTLYFLLPAPASVAT